MSPPSAASTSSVSKSPASDSIQIGTRGGTGSARLLDMLKGRSKQAFKTWLAERPQAWRAGIEVVAMDGFAGSKTANTEELPDAATGPADPAYRSRPDLLTDKQKDRLVDLFAGDEHVQVEAPWEIHQRMIAAYRELSVTLEN